MTNSIKVRLKPEQGIKVGLKTTYIYDNSLIEDEVELAKDWARKTNGQVVEEGENVDYSSKAWAIGGTGTETNNSKYYAEQSSSSASDASDSATLASDKATEAEGHATDAQTWAEGTDAQVELLDGEHSSKGWALASREYTFGGAIYDSDNERIEMSLAYQDLAEVAKTNSYNDLDDLPTIGSGTLTIQKNSATINTFSANSTSDTTINITVPTSAADVGAMPSSTTIADLTSTAQLNALNSGITSTDVSQITTNKNNIASIDGMIPSQASSSNKLADKNFVNSSIATNTANFIGTFNSVAELEAYSGTVTNNDYAFVVGTDSDGNTIYDRYKYTTATTPASWVYEYTLNNSSFTAAQWAAINSGATSTNIGQIATNTTSIGTLSSLTTTEKTNLVGAINELDSGKVDDVTVNGTSVVTGGVAQIPNASGSDYGVTKLTSSLTSTSNTIAAAASTINSLAKNIITGADLFDKNSTYAVGDKVRYSTGYYECNTAITTGHAWNASEWTQITIQGQIDGKIGYTLNTNVSVAGNTKDVAKTNPETLYVPNGLVMGGSAAAAGLVTRGICGCGVPNTSGGTAKDSLYINYDGDSTYRSDRQLILQAGVSGTHYGNNLYEYAAARGDAVKGYCDEHYDTLPTVTTLSNGASLTLANNTFYNGATVTSFSVTCPTGATNAFCCEIDFSSGATATTITYNSTINWVDGSDSILYSGSTTVFTPAANARYNLLIWYDGTQWNGLAKVVG